MKRKTLRALLALGLLTGGLLSLGVVSGWLGITLPTPTGTSAVGRINHDLVDPARRELFGPNPTANRELMVAVYYPAHPPANAKPARHN